MPNCQKELPTYVDLARRQQSGSFTVIGLSIDGQEGFGGAWALLEELGNDFKSLIGEADGVQISTCPIAVSLFGVHPL